MKNKIIAILFVCVTAFVCGCRDSKTALHVYTWSDYFDPEMIIKFENTYNCHVVIDTFDSNEAMYAKLKAGGTGYDVMMPTSYQVEILAEEGMIDNIDHSKLKNVKANFNHKLDNQVLDKNMTWSVPYACTYTGLMCDSKVANDAKSWNVLGNSKYRGKISLLDDIRETIGIGLMYNGYSLNSTNADEIAKAAQTIIGWKNNVRKFDAESYKLEVANKSSLIGHGYSSDAAQVIIEDGRDDISFVLPDEGFTIAWDEFVIAASAPQKDLAYKFIDFFYETEVAKQNMLYVCGLMANGKAFELLPDNYKALLIPKNIDRGQLMTGIHDKNVMQLYNKAWDDIKSMK